MPGPKNKHEECGQNVMIVRVKSMGEWTNQRFTARPAVVYIITGADGQTVRFAEGERLWLYHDAVCPRRQTVKVAGAAECSSCGAPIRWAISPAGARLPLDYAPITVYTMDESTVVPFATEYPALEPLYLSHFASCPSAGLHTRTKPK